MPIYYFHVNGDMDDYGTELPNVAEARRQALETLGGILRNGGGETLWEGNPVKLKVTDQPSGSGKTLFEISVSVTAATGTQK
jgi:hypothetical protein